MRACASISLLLTFLAAFAVAVDDQHHIDILVWPIHDSEPQTLASIAYDSTTATVKQYNAPRIADGTDVVRVGFDHPSGEWSGIATSSLNFGSGKQKKLQLLLNAEGTVYHIGFGAKDAKDSSKSSDGEDGGLSVEVVPMKPAPTVRLNKPVVLNAEGKPAEEQAEKTFFQKYWWVILGFLLLQVLAGGGGKE